MKRIRSLLPAFLFTINAFAQGFLNAQVKPANTVQFPGDVVLANRDTGGGFDAPVYDTDCRTPLSGSAFLAQAYIGLASDSLQPLGLTASFREGPQSGYILPVIVEVPFASNQEVFYQIRVWENAAGATYEAAVANGGKHGFSNIILVEASVPPLPPGTPFGLESFCLVPEPGTILLLAFGALLLLARTTRQRWRFL